jgi:hypothetical protein
MKVLVCSNFRKKMKKMKFLSSMRNKRFHLSKCRGRVQKMGVLCIHSPKMPDPSSNFLIRPKIKNKKAKKLEGRGGSRGQPVVCQTAGHSM